MLPRHVPTLQKEDAKKFIKQDNEPLSRGQIEHLKRSLMVYKKNPVK